MATENRSAAPPSQGAHPWYLMSRAFVKDDAPDEPPVIPPRAPLPAGVPNYVTPRGLALLREERADLEAERSRISASSDDGPEENDRKRQLAIATGRLKALNERLARSQVVDLRSQPPEVVRISATVTAIDGDGAERTVRVVGVDEADASEGRVAFTSPIARALIGKRVGETVEIQTPRGEESLTLQAIAYE